MEYNIDNIKKEIDKILPQVISIRRYIHMHPELSEQEELTCGLICSTLKSMDIEYRGNVAGYGVCATIYGQNRDHGVGIRADMDALPLNEAADIPFRSVNPGVMHGCGHDIHTAILLGAAMVLSKLQAYLPGCVRLLFQPAEETIGGARQMIEDGCLKNPHIQSVIGLHVDSSVEVGSIELVSGIMNAASCEFYVTVTGRSCHGAHPCVGTDPLLPACEMVTSLQSIITRKTEPTESALITVGKFNSGSKNNIIPGETSFSGIIRTLTLANRNMVKKELESMCTAIANAHGAQCTVTFYDSYPPLENHRQLLKIVKSAAEDALGRDKISVSERASMGADDFAYFCRSSRGLYFNLGVRRPGDTEPYPLHSERFNPDEGCIRTGILAETVSALKILDEESKEW